MGKLLGFMSGVLVLSGWMLARWVGRKKALPPIHQPALVFSGGADMLAALLIVGGILVFLISLAMD